MTNHPLTGKRLFIEFLSLGRDYYPDNSNGFSYDDMRTAADWQLEQCITWLENLDPKYTLAKHSTLAKMMRAAMRPQQQEDN